MRWLLSLLGALVGLALGVVAGTFAGFVLAPFFLFGGSTLDSALPDFARLLSTIMVVFPAAFTFGGYLAGRRFAQDLIDRGKNTPRARLVAALALGLGCLAMFFAVADLLYFQQARQEKNDAASELARQQGCELAGSLARVKDVHASVSVDGQSLEAEVRLTGRRTGKYEAAFVLVVYPQRSLDEQRDEIHIDSYPHRIRHTLEYAPVSTKYAGLYQTDAGFCESVQLRFTLTPKFTEEEERLAAMAHSCTTASMKPTNPSHTISTEIPVKAAYLCNDGTSFTRGTDAPK